MEETVTRTCFKASRVNHVRQRIGTSVEQKRHTAVSDGRRLTNLTDVSDMGFHPCLAGGDETVTTLISQTATCDDHFFKMSDNPETLLTAKNGSFVIMCCDVLCCIWLMALYWRFKHEMIEFEEKADKENVTPADYAVEVTGIPVDANDEEVIRHFSELFRLDKPGWTFPGWGCCALGKKSADMPEDVVDCGGVSIGASLEPVKSTAHSRFDHVCRGSWLAECSLAHPEGDFIRQLQSKAERFEQISWKTSAAFVVFNHETSVVRCLADYARYPLWMQPRQLRFREKHRITVQRAPEAANILWENLELTQKERAHRKTLTLWVTIVLLTASFALLYASNIAEKEFNAAIASSEQRCLVTIPAEHGLPPATPYAGGFAPEGICASDDIWVTLEGSPYQTNGQENTCVDPCVDPTDWRNMDCESGTGISPWQIASCLCRQEIEEHGTGAIDFVRKVGGGCWEYGTKYTIGKILTLVASVNVVVINFGLKWVLKRMGTYERHPSVTEQAVSNTWKISLALFINSACVVLLVNLPNSFTLFGSENAMTAAKLAAESAEGVEWYTTTGQALITTIAINVFAPRLPDLVEHFALGPWRRRPAAASSVITQRQLNRDWKGRNFDLSARLPITLMMLAVAVTFSPALPVLFPMVAVYLVATYFGDKFYLLRACCTPPQVRSQRIRFLKYFEQRGEPQTTTYDGRIVKVAAHAMPMMLVCHCMFAIYVFSAGTFFESDYVADVLSSSVDDNLSGDGGAQGATRSATKSVKLLCLPYIIMPALLALYALFTSTVGRLFRLWWSAITCKCFRGAAKVSGPKIKVTNPAYTEVFERGYPPREPVPAFFQQKMNWVIRQDARGCKFLQKTRQKAKDSPKSRKNNGSQGPEVMLTWEVLRSIYPAHTYHLEDNPAYRDIVVTRNVIAKELGITTPKSPGGKLWSPADYDTYNGVSKPSSARRARKTKASD
ncbi:conserved unknown protein [Ectocarpus siliculosus]|uniref:CSC1/OSCA1-like 7TM region domain-containing protein n=1 Tax=Ectocarpus siliculosus TaxID=2880 RepID=D7G870_ECTSI|nr:conserved unknown protein [Ectocarpus siliculosus]|eukprot:CBJ27933.1 conserved unknown protein [Ectocarpus siliculosus]